MDLERFSSPNPHWHERLIDTLSGPDRQALSSIRATVGLALDDLGKPNKIYRGVYSGGRFDWAALLFIPRKIRLESPDPVYLDPSEPMPTTQQLNDAINAPINIHDNRIILGARPKQEMIFIPMEKAFWQHSGKPVDFCMVKGHSPRAPIYALNALPLGGIVIAESKSLWGTDLPSGELSDTHTVSDALEDTFTCVGQNYISLIAADWDTFGLRVDPRAGDTIYILRKAQHINVQDRDILRMFELIEGMTFAAYRFCDASDRYGSKKEHDYLKTLFTLYATVTHQELSYMNTKRAHEIMSLWVKSFTPDEFKVNPTHKPGKTTYNRRQGLGQLQEIVDDIWSA